MKKLNISSFFIIAFLLIGFTGFSQQNSAPNTSLDFDGTDDHVRIGKTYTIPGSNAITKPFDFENGITIQAWVDIRSIKTAIITTDSFSSSFISTKSFNVFLNSSDSKIYFSIRTYDVSNPTSTPTQKSLSSTVALTTSRWTHIACTYDKTKMKIYINGVLSGEKAVTGVMKNNDNDNDNDIYIGAKGALSSTGTTSNFVEGSFVPLTIPKITSVSYDNTTTAITTSTVRVATDVMSASITGTAGAGNTVTLYRGMTATANTAIADTDGNYTITGVPLTVGNNTFKVKASKAGHTHPEESTTVLIVRRTTIPQAPAITAPTTLTKMTSITISGTADTNSYI